MTPRREQQDIGGPGAAARVRSDSVRHRSRAGFTLVELLVVVSALGVLFASVAMTLHTLAHVNQKIQRELPQTQSLTRLVLQLRDDAHQAAAASVAATVQPDDTLRLDLPDNVQITYEIRSGAVFRKLVLGDQPGRQTVYRLPGASTLSWVMVPEQARQVQLKIAQPVELRAGRGLAVKDIHITAAVGLVAAAR